VGCVGIGRPISRYGQCVRAYAEKYKYIYGRYRTADRQSTDQLLLMCADRGNNGILGLWDWSLNKHSVKGTSL